MPCFFFCFWRLFSNRLKEKNAEILRKMFHYITSADDATNKQVNCVIQEIYFALLNESADSANFLENLKNELFKSREQQKSSHSKIIGIKRSGQVKTNSEFADLTLETVTHTTNHNVPQSSKSKILGEDHKFSQTQIQLILRMEGIRDWLVLVNSCGLLDELDPPLPPIFSLEKHIRVGSWNLNRFGLSKAKHPGFMEVVCLTILRANFSLILLQEVSDPAVAEAFCSELNFPSLPHIKQWIEKHPPIISPSWKASCCLQPTGSMFRGKEYAIFLYNSGCGIRISGTSLLEKTSNSRSAIRKSFTRSPCGASCHIQRTKLVLISVHLKASGLRNSQIGQTISEIQSLGYLVQAFYETQPRGTHLIIAGDFNLFPSHEVYHALYEHGLWPVLKDEQQTSLSRYSRKNNSFRAYDNAWLSADLSLTSKSDACWTGYSGIILKGLKHPLIPEETGSGANGFVSDHAPIWFDIRVP